MKKLITKKWVKGEDQLLLEIRDENCVIILKDNNWEPGYLYSGFEIDKINIDGKPSIALLKYLTRLEWAFDGWLELRGSQLVAVEPDHSFYYPQPDRVWVIAEA